MFRPLWIFLASFCLGGAGFESAAAVLNYQGRISVDGIPFQGTGHFSFMVVDATGPIYWTSGEIPFQGRTNLPSGTITLPVQNGLYTVRLGDAANGMPALDLSRLAKPAAPFLRVWFNDCKRGWQPAGDDVPLANTLASGASAAIANDAVMRELKDLRAQVERLQGNQRQIPAQPAQPVTGTVTIGDGPSLGRTDAPLVLVEFTDYQCPFCKRFQDETMAQVITNYVNTGKLRVVTRNLPLPFHPHAEPAAQAALCADQQKNYWPMREKLFAISPNLDVTNLLQAAGELNLNLDAFRTCLDDKGLAAQFKKDSKEANAVGITGTPSFVLGKPLADGKVTGQILVGAMPYAAFDMILQKLLSAK